MRQKFLIFIVITLFITIANSLVFHLRANEELCLDEQINYDTVVHGEFRSLGAKSEMFAVQVLAPEGQRIIWEKYSTTEGSFGFTAEEYGDYRFCFRRITKGKSLPLVAEMSFQLNTGVDAKDYSAVAKKEHLKPIEVEMKKAEDMIKEILNSLTEWQVREEAHRDTSETANETIVNWSIFTLILIVGLGLYQTWSLKRFLKTKRVID
eukprot:TRINITY_DN6245_c0_g1_i1.p1 TRINITY_DN6245_c0_g1~~TRINITY_DN6245_c0_g1_i1.p1  ORF type:complete len:208 (+),score=54.94 TRINITY_DN6245_c0_g1_i1:31-654(+)